MELKDFIRPSTVIVEYELPMRDCVKLMIDKQISSVLVVDKSDNLVGIITERDIVRKFTLLDVEDKLERTAGTVMSRPLKFIRHDNIIPDLLKLHMDMKVRHFPIVVGDVATPETLQGMLSVTDVLRFFLTHKKNELKSNQVDDIPVIEVGMISKNEKLIENYRSILAPLFYRVVPIPDFAEFYRTAEDHHPIMFDVDSFKAPEQKALIPTLLKYPGHLLVVTANVDFLGAFRKFTNKEKQAAAIKPLDFSYINWLLREKWGDKK